MKRIILSAVASLMLAAPLAAPAAVAQQYGQDRNYNNNDRDRRDNDRRDDRRDNNKWDNRQNNGYYLGKTWHWGPPPASVYRRSDYRPAWRSWRKGDRLGYYQTRYVEVDWRARHLRAPPRGYHYVRDDRGDILLAAIATGLIASIIAGNG